jgi:tetratricopeptide (TPR) repeat protein
MTLPTGWPVKLALFVGALLGAPQGVQAGCNDCKRCDNAYDAAKRISPGSSDYLPRLEKAVQTCRSVPVENMGARPFIALGVAYNERKRYHDAIALFDEALQHEPGLSLAYANKGSALIELGQLDEAIRVMEEGVALPDDDAHYKALLNHNLGFAYVKLAAKNGDNRVGLRGEPFFKRATELEPGLAESWFFRGVLAEDPLQRFGPALEYYQKACDLKDIDGCIYGTRLKDRISRQPPVELPPVRELTSGDEAVIEAFVKNYELAGYGAESLESLRKDWRKSCRQVEQDVCRQQIERTSAHLQGQPAELALVREPTAEDEALIQGLVKKYELAGYPSETVETLRKSTHENCLHVSQAACRSMIEAIGAHLQGQIEEAKMRGNATGG